MSITNKFTQPNKELKAFNIRLTPDLRKWVDKKAKSVGMSVASYIRFVLLSIKNQENK